MPRFSFTQPVCPGCWNERHPEKLVDPSKLEYAGESERCCDCNTWTRCGIYIRVDPTTVPHPTLTKE